jgi:hypothetical protein
VTRYQGNEAFAANVPFKIDPEFAKLLPEPTDLVLEELRASIKSEGIREPLVVWAEGDVLLDGHTRLRIAQELGQVVRWRRVPCYDRDEAEEWIFRNQLGRRNLGENEISYFRGKLLEARKRQGARNDLEDDDETFAHSEQKSVDTAAQVAEETGVSRATVVRDAQFARAVDAVAEVAPEIKADIFKGTATKKAVVAVARIADPEARKAAAKVLVEPRTTEKKAKRDRGIDKYVDTAVTTAQKLRRQIAQLDERIERLHASETSKHWMRGVWELDTEIRRLRARLTALDLTEKHPGLNFTESASGALRAACSAIHQIEEIADDDEELLTALDLVAECVEKRRKALVVRA